MECKNHNVKNLLKILKQTYKPGMRFPYVYGESSIGKTYTISRLFRNTITINPSGYTPSDFLVQTKPNNGKMIEIIPQWVTLAMKADVLTVDELDKVHLPTIKSALLTIFRERKIGTIEFDCFLIGVGNTLEIDEYLLKRLIPLKWEKCKCDECLPFPMALKPLIDIGLTVADVQEIHRMLLANIDSDLLDWYLAHVYPEHYKQIRSVLKGWKGIETHEDMIEIMEVMGRKQLLRQINGADIDTLKKLTKAFIKIYEKQIKEEKND